MSNARTCLQQETLVSLLEDALPPHELPAVEEHLTECSDCRARVERAIGPGQLWDEVRQSLLDPNQSTGETFDTCTASTKQLKDLLGPTDDPMMLGRIGTYEVSGVLGQGGMGAVFKAFDRSLNRYTAIKMLLPHLAASAAARKRFAREAQASAAVVDDHVMAVHHVDEWQNIPYLVMPYTKGVSLQQRLAEKGILDLREILRISLQAAKGLTAAHAQGLVHRDIKPANIFLSENVERVQLVDFGLARAADDASLTRTGIVAGTPQYMSPEQARAETVSFRSDLFSLGSVMYTMCTGRPPFRADSSHAVLRLITDKTPRPIREINPDIPHWLCTIIARLMAKDPAERFESAAEVAEILEGCLAHVQQPDTVSLPDELQPPATADSRFRNLMLMCAGAAILLFGGLFLTADKPDISGEWHGDEWGHVKLQSVQDGVYEGTYTDTFGDGPGKIHLKWSRIERRYKGTWGQGEERHGRISVRLVDDEIRGAWTTSRKADVNPGVPSLADLMWHRAESFVGTGTPVTGTLMPVWLQKSRSADGAEITTAQRLAQLLKSDSALRRVCKSIHYRGSVDSMRTRIAIDTTERTLRISFTGPAEQSPEDATAIARQIMRCFISFIKDEQQTCVAEVCTSLQQKLRELQPRREEKLARDYARDRLYVDRPGGTDNTDDEDFGSWPRRDDPRILDSRLRQLYDEVSKRPVLKLVVTELPSVPDEKDVARRRQRFQQLKFADVLNDLGPMDSFPVSVELVTSKSHGESSVNTFALRNNGTTTRQATFIESFQPPSDAANPVHRSGQWSVMDLPPGESRQDTMAIFSRPLKIIVYGPYDLETGTREVLGIYSSEKEKEPERSTEIDQLRDDIDAKRRAIITLRQHLRKTYQNNDTSDRSIVPDGIITHVDEENGLVNLNIGSADGLRNGVRFSVVARPVQFQSRLSPNRPKAKIEVTEILGTHSAEARILSQAADTVILRRDVIHSPVFQGRLSVRIAVAGETRLGGLDAKASRRILNGAGGSLSLEIDETGRIVDENGKELSETEVDDRLMFHTQFLIVPVSGSGSSEQVSARVREKAKWFRNRAFKLGVPQIDMPTFLEEIGYPEKVMFRTPDQDLRNSQRTIEPSPPTPSGNELVLAIYIVMDALKGDENAWLKTENKKRWQAIVAEVHEYEGHQSISADELLFVADAAFFNTTAMQDAEGNRCLVEVTLSKEGEVWQPQSIEVRPNENRRRIQRFLEDHPDARSMRLRKGDGPYQPSFDER